MSGRLPPSRTCSTTALPSHVTQVDPTALIEHDPLLFQKLSLIEGPIRLRPGTHLSFGVDHAVPRDVGPVGQCMECVPNLPCVTGQACEPGHLSIRGHGAGRYSAEDGVDLFVVAGSARV